MSERLTLEELMSRKAGNPPRPLEDVPDTVVEMRDLGFGLVPVQVIPVAEPVLVIKENVEAPAVMDEPAPPRPPRGASGDRQARR